MTSPLEGVLHPDMIQSTENMAAALHRGVQMERENVERMESLLAALDIAERTGYATHKNTLDGSTTTMEKITDNVVLLTVDDNSLPPFPASFDAFRSATGLKLELTKLKIARLKQGAEMADAVVAGMHRLAQPGAEGDRDMPLHLIQLVTDTLQLRSYLAELAARGDFGEIPTQMQDQMTSGMVQF